VTEAVLALASEPTPVVKTLDALHLATARQVRALAVSDLVLPRMTGRWRRQPPHSAFPSRVTTSADFRFTRLLFW
jgi:hypothetical protein